MRVKEINALSAEDRANKLADLRIELARFRTMVNAGGAVENPTRIRELRRTIAQILTIENEKKLGIRQSAESKGEKPAKPPKAKKSSKEPVSK
jgi:large subunit ribosomal protein L29